jgi:hypothetical protein
MVLPQKYDEYDQGKQPPDNHPDSELNQFRTEQNIEVKGKASQLANESAHDAVLQSGTVFHSFYWVSGANCLLKRLYAMHSTSFRHPLTPPLGLRGVESLYVNPSTSFAC